MPLPVALCDACVSPSPSARGLHDESFLYALAGRALRPDAAPPRRLRAACVTRACSVLVVGRALRRNTAPLAVYEVLCIRFEHPVLRSLSLPGLLRGPLQTRAPSELELRPGACLRLGPQMCEVAPLRGWREPPHFDAGRAGYAQRVGEHLPSSREAVGAMSLSTLAIRSIEL